MRPYYRRHGCTIYHADSRAILESMQDASVDLLLTDPPYGHNNNDGDLIERWEEALSIPKRKTQGRAPRPIANDSPKEASELVQFTFFQANRLLRHGGCCCCCCCGGGGPDPQFARWSLWMDQYLQFKQMVVWNKGGLGMGWHYRRNYETVLVGQKPGGKCKWYGGHSVANVISDVKKPRYLSTDHPTPKPVELFERFIQWHSLPGETVLDPFMGAGTTLIAARNLKRKAIGIEIDERWCELAARRLDSA